ncbi:hypothetical protein [Spiroplasma poulsonii]|uniref:hypothetical protein n=1 Tax=Spiroplasma poulsonii TaxID=2138 RepID=UPI001F4C900F|nr:hypothetical protein [Spiroplasma poulsonii]UNF62195.1 hypothetical protein MNU24_01640 [Spiroplasma poulsonii]
MFKAKKHQTSLNKEAGIINRVTWIRKMFVQGKIYGTLDNFPFLDKCISELRFSDTKTNTPDSKMYHDPYDAQSSCLQILFTFYLLNGENCCSQWAF